MGRSGETRPRVTVLILLVPLALALGGGLLSTLSGSSIGFGGLQVGEQGEQRQRDAIRRRNKKGEWERK